MTSLPSDASPRRTSWIRLALAAAIALLLPLPVLILGSLLGLDAERLGWLWMSLLYAGPLLLAAVVLGARRRGVALGVALLLACGLGMLDWRSSPPTHDRIAEQADTVDVPAGWVGTGEDRYGSTWCFKGCPEVQRTYTFTGSYPDARDRLLAALDADGWRPDIDVSTPRGTERLERGRWTVTVREQTYVEEPTLTLSFSG